MLQLISLLGLLSATSALFFPDHNGLDILNSTLDERIIGGNEVRKNAYPFMVRLSGTNGNGDGHLCGATLIHENYVVTAAHCVYDADEPVVSVTLHFGDHHMYYQENTESSMRIPMSNIQVHSQYNPNTVSNDIALIRLPQRAPLSAHVQPTCVASASTVSRYSSAKALGWGLTRNSQQGGSTSTVLKEIDLPILTDYDCRMFGYGFNGNIMMCAGNTRGIQAAICSGDSGGPYLVNPSKLTLAGISSYVSSRGCVTVGYGVVFVRVSAYIPWLQNFMGSALCVA